jgi:hypothetical protein
MRKGTFLLAFGALVTSAVFATLASAADHRESPVTTANPSADINDVYAFLNPSNPSNFVVAITVNPFIAPSDNATKGVFDGLVYYQVHVDRNGDLGPDATISIRKAGESLIVEGLGAPVTAGITPPGATPVITTAGAVRVFAGLRDDPFFFDIPGFQAFLANQKLPAPGKGLRAPGGGDPIDAFAGTNVMAIVIEAPVTAITGGSAANSGTIKTWVTTSRAGRIDRMAIPLVAAALFPPGAGRDPFNASDPNTDVANFTGTVVGSVERLRGIADTVFGPMQPGGALGRLTPAQVAAIVLPDVVTIDFSKPVQFPNGRRLQDDVLDATLGIVMNRGGAAGVSDGINANDRPFLATFPYLAEPHTSGAAPSPVTPPSTGDAGLVDRETGWLLSAVFLAAALALGSVATLATARGRGR